MFQEPLLLKPRELPAAFSTYSSVKSVRTYVNIIAKQIVYIVYILVRQIVISVPNCLLRFAT
jgi:hypothetical protein